MKKITIRFLLFGATFFVVASIIDILYSSQAKYAISTDCRIWNDIYEHKISEPCLIYGSSRAMVHINPFLLEDSTNIAAYNFGMPGQIFDMQYLRHKINIQNNGNPQYVIYSLDAFTLARNQEFIPNGVQFLPYIYWNLSLRKELNSYFHEYSFFLPLVRYYDYGYISSKVLRNLFTDKDLKGISKGYVARDQEWDDSIKIPQIDTNLNRIDIDTTIINKFENFLTECKNSNIKVALVYTPEYIVGQMYMSNRDSIVHLYDSLAIKHKVPFFDYSKDEMASSTAYFSDAMHLNKQGSHLITKKIITDLKKIQFFDKK